MMPEVLLTSGALVMGYTVAALFFLRFWRDTRDRLFAWFCAAFVVLAVQRLALSVMPHFEYRTALYMLRLAAFVLILVAIADKNRSS